MRKRIIKLIFSLLTILTLSMSFGTVNPASEVLTTGNPGSAEQMLVSGKDIIVQFGGDIVPWGVSRVGAEVMHTQNKGRGVRVAILDTGVDLDHPDLSVAGNVTFVSRTKNGDDDNGHGTIVAGIIAALDNGIGVVGVAPEVELYSVKVLNKNGMGALSSIVHGIRWAIDNNMHIINMSFGNPIDMPQSVITALNDAYDAGIIVVTGAGNGGNEGGEGDNVWAPARYESVIAVGAINEQDVRHISSSTGEALELVAPGVNIYSTAMGGGYHYLTGTSAAAPHVAGVAALLIASGLTSNEDIRQWLRSSAKDLDESGWDPQFGYGIVSANLTISHNEPLRQDATIGVSLNGTPEDNSWYLSDTIAAPVGVDLSIFED